MSRKQLEPPLGFIGRSVSLSASKTSATAEGGSKKCPSYKRLPREFRRRGFIYRRIVREADAAIYEQIRNGCFNPVVCFEVILVRRREAFVIGDRRVEAAEVYPNSEAWGVDGFTLTEKQAALAKLKKLTGDAVNETYSRMTTGPSSSKRIATIGDVPRLSLARFNLFCSTTNIRIFSHRRTSTSLSLTKRTAR